MSDNWAIVYQNSNPHHIEIVRSVLEDNGIKVVLLNKKDSMHVHLSNADIELYVKTTDVINAKYIISKNQL